MSDLVYAAAGGALIGAAAWLLFAMNGRVAGISGIVGSAVRAPTGDRGWRLAFVAGLIGSGWLGTLLLPEFGLPMRSGFSVPLLLAAGLLVGLGTAVGSGCTSGHGVCGISRMSLRSLLATVTFILLGMATVFVMRHLLEMLR